METKLILQGPADQPADKARTSWKYEASLEKVIVYEFYVPNAMLQKEETGRFLQEVIGLRGGGTVFPDMLGVWQGQVEKVTIYRIVVRTHQFASDNADRWIAEAIAQLMHQLQRTDAEQHEVMFTKSECQAYSIKSV